jgi:protein kinase C substrate 80K-H
VLRIRTYTVLILTHILDCDCPDGSDEPGTSACAHLSSGSPQVPGATNATLVLPGFYCKNKGHIPSYIPFTNVNDGFCDCCDGSEEFGGVGGVKCENRCAVVGKEWRKQDEARQKSLSNAAKKRKDLVAQAARMRKEVEDRIQSLGTEIAGAEVKVKNLEGELAEVQKKEKGKVVKAAASGKGGKLGVLIELARERMDELRESLIRVRGERDSSRSRLQELEDILSTFKEEYNPNFNDEGVKRAVRAWEDYAARDKGPDVQPAMDRDLDEITKSDQDNGIDWDEYETEDENDTDVCECYQRPNATFFANMLQYTRSKTTSHRRCAAGLTRNCVTYGSV